MGGPVAIGGDNLPSPVRIGLTDLQNIGGASGPPGPPGSGTTADHFISIRYSQRFFNLQTSSSDAGTGGATGATGPPNILQIS